jgi:hypothetical protein
VTPWALCFILWRADGSGQTYCPPNAQVLYRTKAECKKDLLAGHVDKADLPILPKDVGVTCVKALEQVPVHLQPTPGGKP